MSSDASSITKMYKKMQLYLAIWEGQNSIFYPNWHLYSKRLAEQQTRTVYQTKAAGHMATAAPS